MSAAAINPPSSATILPFAEHSKATRDTRPLRLITCGSVDDGKSTLIGRLLWDTKAVKEDQAATLHRDSGKQNDLGLPDFALLLDGRRLGRGLPENVADGVGLNRPRIPWGVLKHAGRHCASAQHADDGRRAHQEPVRFHSGVQA